MLVAWIGQQVEDEAECRSAQDTVKGAVAPRRTGNCGGSQRFANPCCDFYLVPGDLQKLLLVFHLRGNCIKECSNSQVVHTSLHKLWQLAWMCLDLVS